MLDSKELAPLNHAQAKKKLDLLSR